MMFCAETPPCQSSRDPSKRAGQDSAKWVKHRAEGTLPLTLSGIVSLVFCYYGITVPRKHHPAWSHFFPAMDKGAHSAPLARELFSRARVRYLFIIPSPHPVTPPRLGSFGTASVQESSRGATPATARKEEQKKLTITAHLSPPQPRSPAAARRAEATRSD